MTHEQLDVFAPPAEEPVDLETPAGIERAFWRFHDEHPDVLTELVKLTRQAQRAGVTKVGIGALFEVLRWNRALSSGGERFRLNNNFRSYYARLIMTRHPELDGIFETRRLHS